MHVPERHSCCFAENALSGGLSHRDHVAMTAPGSSRSRRRRTRWILVAGTLLLIAGLASAGRCRRSGCRPRRVGTPWGRRPSNGWIGRAPSRPPRPARHRFVVTQLWYPAARDASGLPGWYLGRDANEAEVVARGVAEVFGVPALVFDQAARARTPAFADIPVVGGPERFPVVLFSPGLPRHPTAEHGLGDRVASHGYVVAALDHPYDSAVVVRTDSTPCGAPSRPAAMMSRTSVGPTAGRRRGPPICASC